MSDKAINVEFYPDEPLNGTARGRLRAVHASTPDATLHEDCGNWRKASLKKRFEKDASEKLYPDPDGDDVKALAVVKKQRRKAVRDLDRLIQSALDEKQKQAAAGGADNADDYSPSQSKALIKLSEKVELFHDGNTAYGTLEVNEHRETYPVKRDGFRQLLSRRYWQVYRKSVCRQAMQDAVDEICGRAIHDGPQKSVAVRVAGHEGSVYLDLCNEHWQAARITSEGWQVVSDPPVKFVRRRGMLPLPLPVEGGKISEAKTLLNLDEENWILSVGWLVGTLSPVGPYPALAVNGPQGSGKSTFCRMLRGLIDPNEAALRRMPRDDRDLMIAAKNSWIVGFDNLSSLSRDMADSLCRLSTTGDFSTRELYSDDDEHIIHAVRPILFNGIEELASHVDLLDRSITVTLGDITDDNRRTEKDLWREYERCRPNVLGALLSAVSIALRELPTVKVAHLPRMADFAKWVRAAEGALPWNGTRDFIDIYRKNRRGASSVALECSAVGPAIVGFMLGRESWKGTAKELLAAIGTEQHSDSGTRERRDWPRSPQAMKNALRRLVPVLKASKIIVHFDGPQGHTGQRILRLEKDREQLSALSALSANLDSEPITGITADNPRTNADNPQTTPETGCQQQNADSDSETHSADNADDADNLAPVDSAACEFNPEDEP